MTLPPTAICPLEEEIPLEFPILREPTLVESGEEEIGLTSETALMWEVIRC